MSGVSCGYRSTPWKLSSTSSFMLTALSTFSGVDRYRLAASVLERALDGEASSSGTPPSIALRENTMSPGRIRLPNALIDAIGDEAAQRGWSPELLVEYLIAKYVPHLLGEAASARAAGLLLTAPTHVIGSGLAHAGRAERQLALSA